jgi:hypothetical protein
MTTNRFPIRFDWTSVPSEMLPQKERVGGITHGQLPLLCNSSGAFSALKRLSTPRFIAQVLRGELSDNSKRQGVRLIWLFSG